MSRNRTGWFLELAFEFPGTQPLAQGRVIRDSATRVYIGLLGRCPYSSLADSGWRGNGFSYWPGSSYSPLHYVRLARTFTAHRDSRDAYLAVTAKSLLATGAFT
ncbi:hypothetical protein KQX54_014457 [Cotesia glomerata]|uniref:Uncharacterized protein n=1 Tax=Cotesia glomerata TaxID=32391 RepID=A0AAV7J9N6_COTGL|nr:hypothetical protein KQX54_014457 [Cotesia glomerata]